MKLSLRSLIAIPLIGQIVVVTALTGWLTYRNNQAAIQELAYQILDEAGRHLDHQLTDYTKIPTLITQENLDTLKLQNLNSDELERWLPYLYRQIQRFADITYIYYGNTDGQYVEISRLANGDLELALIDGTSDKSEVPNQPVKIYPINDDGQITKAELERSYDPRERPWYKAGLNNQIAGWTDVYDFNDPSPTFGLSFIRPYTSINDQIQGVLGADFTLRDLETFLIHNQPSRSSISFIMDASGKILASSEGTSSFRKSRGSSATTLSERDKKDNVVVSTAINQILRDFSDRKQPNYDQQFRFRINQEHYWGQLTPFSDKYGLNWLGVSLIPESDFTQQLHANNRNTLLLCIIAMMASTGISLVIARFLSTPMERLGLATQAIAQNQIHQRLLPSSIHELNLLIDSFNRMGADLGESRAQLNTHSQQLETLINQRTEALRRSEETFAKAFQVSPNAITLSTVKEGRYIKVNDRFVDLMGLPREKIVGRTSVELGVWIPPQTREVFYQELSNGRLRNQEWKVQNALGEVKTILLSAEIIHFQESTAILTIGNDISDRTLEQTELRQSEERWQLALKGNNDGIWDWNIAAGEIFYSERWKAMLGYGNDEISNNKDEWKQRLHPHDRDRVLQATQEHLDQKTSFFSEEYRLRCKNGDYKWILDRGQALWDHEGNPIRMVGSHTDISEQKQFEAIIQQQEQFLRSIYNSVETGIFVVDVLGSQQFRYVDSNATVKRISGASRPFMDATPEELFTSSTAVEINRKYQSCVDYGETLTFEEKLLINERWTWWLTTLNPLKNEAGQVYRIIGTTINITQRKTTEEALAQQVQSEQLLSSISNQVRQSLNTQKTYPTTVDQIGLAFGASRCCLHIYGETPIPHITNAAEYLIPDYASCLNSQVPITDNPHIQAVLAQDLAIVINDVTAAPLLQTVQPFWDSLQIKSMIAIRTSYQGKPNGVIEVHQCDRQRTWLPWEIDLLEDVAAQVGIAIAQAHLLEQERTQQEALIRQNTALEQAIEAAQQASQVKSQFLANMSHELRTPLNAILGFVQIMQRTLKSNPQRFQQESANHLQIIENSGDHLLTLINDILDMAKIEAGQMTVNSNAFNLHTLLGSIKAMFQAKAHEKELTLKCEYAPEVPKYIETDEAKLRQILINLVGNAIKFTHVGHVIIKVWGQQTLHVEVQDTGKGIPLQDIDLLFDAFYQTQAGMQAQGGTGLGLSISQNYIKLLGGNLSVASTPNQGSVFQFSIPVTVIKHSETSLDTPDLTVVRLAPSQPNYRILVVEDKWTSRTLLIKLLESAGFDVQGADNGKIALKIWEEWHPQLIWMDMRMPVMDGYETTRHIRSHDLGQATIIIALTASVLTNEKQVILAAGCDDFVRKPFQEKIIFEKLQQYLGVQYIYEQPSDIDVTTSLEKMPQISSKLLAQQPQSWLTQLHSAASLADSEWVFELLKQQPIANKPLTNSLIKLVKGFRCDLIAEASNLALQQDKA